MDLEKVERVKLVATEFTLLSVDFLDKHQKICSAKGQWKWVEMIFSSGEIIRVTVEEFKSLEDFKFTLGGKDKMNN